MVALERFGNLFAGSTLCVVGILVEKKNTGWSSCWPPWCHVFLEPQRGSPSSSQYFSSPVPRHHFCVPPALEDPPEMSSSNTACRTLPTRRGNYTICFPTSGQCGWEARPQTYITQWKRRVPAKQPARVSHGTFMATNLHHDRSIQISLVVVQPLDSNSLLNCLVPRHSYVHNELPKLLTFSPATFLHNQWLQQLTAAMSVSNVAFSNMVCASTWSLICQRLSTMLSCSSSARSLLGWLTQHPCSKHTRLQTIDLTFGSTRCLCTTTHAGLGWHGCGKLPRVRLHLLRCRLSGINIHALTRQLLKNIRIWLLRQINGLRGNPCTHARACASLGKHSDNLALQSWLCETPKAWHPTTGPILSTTPRVTCTCRCGLHCGWPTETRL